MTTYRHDYTAFGRLVLRSEELLGPDLLARCGRVAARAENTAPYDPNDRDGEHYRDAFSVSLVVDKERIRGRVTNSDQAALKVEFGTKNNPKHRTLGNALDAAKD